MTKNPFDVDRYEYLYPDELISEILEPLNGEITESKLNDSIKRWRKSND